MKKFIRKCLKCGTRKDLSRHHTLPLRYFYGKGDVVILWRRDHDKLELLIPFKPKLTKYEYVEILIKFLGGNKWEKKTR